MSIRVRRQITLLPETDLVATALADRCGLSRSHFIECAIVSLAETLTRMQADSAPPFNQENHS